MNVYYECIYNIPVSSYIFDEIGKWRKLQNHATFKSRKIKNLGIDLAPQYINKS